MDTLNNMTETVKSKLEWYKNYLEGYFKDFTELVQDKNAWNYFKSLNIDYKKTYLVFCTDYERLRQFATFYLVLKYARFQTVNMYDFASDLCDNREDLFEKEVMILFNHKHEINLGNTENWLLTTILNKVATRNREGYRTLLLTERRLPTMEKSGEFNCIDLNLSNIPIKIKKDKPEDRRD